MVFESVVAEILNRVLGNFVNNLDASQLNIGIWGGDVKLTNLEVKETALDDFDLPVKLKFGCLTKLVLKIPWNDLYRQPVIADIEEPPDLASNTFTEKFLATIIKNLQVKVRNIHIRYEDKYSHRNRSFVVGATLEGIDFKTTDENWNETIHKEIVKVVYKLVSLRNFTIYWNSNSKLMSDLSSSAAISERMNDAIVVGNRKPSEYKYILEPMNMQVKLALNQRPETDNSNWKIPKIKLFLDLDTLVFAVSKFQYQDLLLLLEAQERFRTAAQYLKYRPHLNDYRDHYREWWHFAYNAIIEEIVRRRRNNWNWNRMKKHRESVRAYKDAWLKKQTEKNLSSKDQNIIMETEEHLDVFNLNVARQQADMEIDRRGMKRLEDQPRGWINWAKNWWSGGSSQGNIASSSDIMTKFEEAMTTEEKTKLFDAIDYQWCKKVAIDGCGQQILFMQDDSIDWLTVLVETNPLNRDEVGYDQYIKVALAPTIMKYYAPAINTAIEALRPPESVRLNQQVS
ncbi:Vacuolar protein sorting-associated protein 13A [Dirofilaria immitis]|nr:Vacuolar protein sorting-associated protein 13A [Dirofilaria immitis]